jgi:molybdopterin/thiamine biosynthesis adenylyltransferase/proteasome lid subunit RPN8/RPN11
VTRYTCTILEELRAKVERAVLRDSNESAALLLCGRSQQIDPWTGEVEERFLARQLIEVAESAYHERTPSRFTWSTTPFYNALKRAEPRDFAVAAIHSHPDGPLAFSPADDVAEQELFRLAVDRLQSERPHLSIVMDGGGRLVARAYDKDLKAFPVDVLRIIGTRWQFFYPGQGHHRLRPELDRQIRTFGPESTEDLGHLRVAVVGCGGTGSAVAAMLGRIGVRRLALIDPDRVDETSLNRLHFSTRVDANLDRLKVDVVAEGVAEIGLPISVIRLPHHADDGLCRAALRSCDIIFGCTDDHLGRNLLNRVAHFYLIPIVDLGLLIEPNASSSYDTFDGRVTVVQPGYPCQVCRKLIDPDVMHTEDLRRHDPALYQQRRRAGYVPDAPDPSPVVVTFTTELAAVAVTEVFQRLTEFRGVTGSVVERVRRFDVVKDFDTLPGATRLPGCKLCQARQYDGRGDMTPFLDQA